MATAFRPSRQASMCSCSTSSTVTSSGMFTVLEMAPLMKGCTAPIILMWPRVVDGVVTHGAGKDRQVLRPHVGRPDDRLVLVDVGDDLVDLLGPVAQLAQSPRDGLVDDRHGAAAHQLLGLHQPEVGLDAGGVAVHQQADGAGRRQHRGLGVAHAVLLGQLDGGVPRLLGRRQQLGRAPVPRRSAPPRPGACAAR